MPETDAIFREVHQVNQAADASDNMLRISLDAKATLKIGEYSRGGSNRVEVAAADHDFRPDATVTPFGFLLPRYGDLFLYFGTSKVTSDFIVDTIEQWWCENKPRFPKIDTLVLLQDNGPENNGRRTQFLHRMVEFVEQHQINVRLAYYPPYHSKYNPVERCWGVLENHWNGSLLDSAEAVTGFAQSMTWKQKHPLVRLATQAYESGVRISKTAMKAVNENSHGFHISPPGSSTSIPTKPLNNLFPENP